MSSQVTIVTSVLNGAKTLSRCLESVAHQTYPCEHIVVDGGSTDGTLEMVRSFGAPHLRLVEAPGAGISRAFNLGIQQATGDFIGILNADDWYEPDAMERSVAGLARNPQAGFSYGAVVVHERDYRVLAQPLAERRLCTRDALVQMPFPHISSLVRHSVYQEHGLFDEAYQVAMDLDFYSRILTRGVKGVFIPGIIGHVMGGGSSSNLPRRWREYWRISSERIGVPLATYHVARFASRIICFESVRRMPGGLTWLSRRQNTRYKIL